MRQEIGLSRPWRFSQNRAAIRPLPAIPLQSVVNGRFRKQRRATQLKTSRMALRYACPDNPEKDYKMRITASHIVNWVDTHAKEAQTNLPRWVRRLCFDAEVTRQLAFPAGDSSFVPGWDGVLSCERGNAWIPTGPSRWEIGCDQNVVGKAEREYKNRTQQTNPEQRLACAFVFVTPRRWTKKSEWIAEQKTKNEWADVRAYDADDLEQWLEQSPSVALQFGEELGLLGSGVESCSRHWQSWSQQCAPAITADALFMDRADVRQNLEARIREAISASTAFHPLAIRADSAEEAAAFTVATVLAAGDLADQSLVVTDADGWRYVEANPQLKVAVAASPEVAQKPVLRAGLFVVVPHVTGNSSGNSQTAELILERPYIYEFEKALIAIGMEESDAKRFAASTGHSWTVLRRQRATNPAIQNPRWLNVPQSASLAMLCLLGTWNTNKEADRQVVSRLANRPYEEIEGDLRQLARLDDAPLLCIGSVWKAKSPLELLGLFGDRITRDQLDRFFAIAREMLEAPDPQLELPDGERWMAQVHGKVHSFSGLIFNSICDALIKLAVRGPEQAGLHALRIGERVESLVHGLLNEADGIRWLSLASHLPPLAEAAPSAFLSAVEKSLLQVDAPVIRLISETGGSGFGGRCWHAGLLWALETLAWDGRRLARVALILAKLSHEPIKGNRGNKPSGSLFGLFRSWLPQTAASLPDRIKVLDLLIRQDADAAFGVLEGLASPWGRQFATPAVRPKWREDDAGAGNGVPQNEMFEMQEAAKVRLFQVCEGNASRIAALLQNNLLKNSEEMPRALALMAPFTHSSAADEDREILRAALRKTIHWHRNYDDMPAEELNVWLAQVEACYEALAPTSLVLRHRWLFESHWVELPSRERDDDVQARSDALVQMRKSALEELFKAQGLQGIELLIAECKEPGTVGASLASVEWVEVDWASWIAANGRDYMPGLHMTWCVGGMLRAMPSPKSVELLRAVLFIGGQQGWHEAKKARFLSLARPDRETWQLASESGPETDSAYWQCVRPDHWRHDEDLPFVLECLLEAKRPRTLLQCCQYQIGQADPKLLFSALQQFMAGEEIDGPMIDSWHLGEMLEQLEKSGEIERFALIQLEFGLFPALGYGQEERARTLYESVMSEPQLFAELISLLYKPRHQEREEPLTEGAQNAASHAWKILHACKRMPGTGSDGRIDADAFTQFIDSVRELCRKADRQAVGDLTLGEILAHAPGDEDGTWPFAPAREVLDRPGADDLRRGFSVGVFNKRGVTTRSPCEGGGQERGLASYYRDQAERVQYSHPNVAAMLEEIAKDYEHHGKREDDEASLRKEGF